LDEEKSKYAGLAQENGFISAQLHKKGALGPSYRPYNNAKISMTFSKENYKTLLS
jgi:hypothetical protein